MILLQRQNFKGNLWITVNRQSGTKCDMHKSITFITVLYVLRDFLSSKFNWAVIETYHFLRNCRNFNILIKNRIFYNIWQINQFLLLYKFYGRDVIVFQKIYFQFLPVLNPSWRPRTTNFGQLKRFALSSLSYEFKFIINSINGCTTRTLTTWKKQNKQNKTKYLKKAIQGWFDQFVNRLWLLYLPSFLKWTEEFLFGASSLFALWSKSDTDGLCCSSDGIYYY